MNWSPAGTTDEKKPPNPVYLTFLAQMQCIFTATRWQQIATHLLNIVFGENLWEAQYSHFCQCLEERM